MMVHPRMNNNCTASYDVKPGYPADGISQGIISVCSGQSQQPPYNMMSNGSCTRFSPMQQFVPAAGPYHLPQLNEFNPPPSVISPNLGDSHAVTKLALDGSSTVLDAESHEFCDDGQYRDQYMKPLNVLHTLHTVPNCSRSEAPSLHEGDVNIEEDQNAIATGPLPESFRELLLQEIRAPQVQDRLSHDHQPISTVTAHEPSKLVQYCRSGGGWMDDYMAGPMQQFYHIAAFERFSNQPLYVNANTLMPGQAPAEIYNNGHTHAVEQVKDIPYGQLGAPVNVHETMKAAEMIEKSANCVDAGLNGSDAPPIFSRGPSQRTNTVGISEGLAHYNEGDQKQRAVKKSPRNGGKCYNSGIHQFLLQRDAAPPALRARKKVMAFEQQSAVARCNGAGQSSSTSNNMICFGHLQDAADHRPGPAAILSLQQQLAIIADHGDLQDALMFNIDEAEDDHQPAAAGAALAHAATTSSMNLLYSNKRRSAAGGGLQLVQLQGGVGGARPKKVSRHPLGPALNTNLKPRARQGSANDPQSIAARQRRERINSRLKALQELVPNGSKVDLVTMLEKAINYVKFLQLQLKVLTDDEFWSSGQHLIGQEANSLCDKGIATTTEGNSSLESSTVLSKT